MGELGLFSCLLLCTLSKVLIFFLFGSRGSTSAGNIADLLLFSGIVTTTSYKMWRLSLDFFHIINTFLGINPKGQFALPITVETYLLPLTVGHDECSTPRYLKWSTNWRGSP